jgi:hypothetical protein
VQQNGAPLARRFALLLQKFSVALGAQAQSKRSGVCAMSVSGATQFDARCWSDACGMPSVCAEPSPLEAPARRRKASRTKSGCCATPPSRRIRRCKAALRTKTIPTSCSEQFLVLAGNRPVLTGRIGRPPYALDQARPARREHVADGLEAIIFTAHMLRGWLCVQLELWFDARISGPYVWAEQRVQPSREFHRRFFCCVGRLLRCDQRMRSTIAALASNSAPETMPSPELAWASVSAPPKEYT